MTRINPSTVIFPNTTGPPYGTTRWVSSELLDTTRFGSEQPSVSRVDRYALGMTVYEVSGPLLSLGRLIYPYSGTQWSCAFPPPAGPCSRFAVLKGERRGKLPNASCLGFTEAQWGLLQPHCGEPVSERPTARQLLNYLRPTSLDRVPPPELSPAAEGAASVPRSKIFWVSRCPFRVQCVWYSDWSSFYRRFGYPLCARYFLQSAN